MFASSSNTSTGVCQAPLANDEFSPHFAKLNQIMGTPGLWPEGADSPSEDSFRWASVVLKKFQEYDFAPTRIVASAEGGIAICFISGDKYSDIECLNSGGILGVNSDRINSPVAWEIDYNDRAIAESVARIRDFLNG
jgi:hypothetical protein